MARMSYNDIDKLDAEITIRIPQVLKDGFDRELSPVARKDLSKDIMILIAKAVHESRFNPLDYLRSD